MNRDATILVADDERPIRKIIVSHLCHQGYHVVEARDGEEALALAESHQPDLLVLDVMMPGLDGFAVCERLRSDIATRQVPILFLSARREEADVLRGLELGGDHYLTKPFSPAELVGQVQAMLRRIRQERDLNPLSGLPGNVAIVHHAENLLDGDASFAFIYIDLDHFKGFNDSYGFEKGDEVIRGIAGALLTAARTMAPPNPFVGHIGGDDFVVISRKEQAKRYCDALLGAFAEIRDEFYLPEDRERGAILTRDRRGNPVEYPLLTMSIGVTLSEQHEGISYAELAAFATECKKKAKTQAGHSVYFDRRQSTKRSRQERRNSSRVLRGEEERRGVCLVGVEPHVVSTRRSIRKFSEQPVSRRSLNYMLEAARLAPSGSNAQPWSFLVVREGRTRRLLAAAACGQVFLEQAPVVIACLGNRKAFRKRLRRGKELLEVGAIDSEVAVAAQSFYKGQRAESGGGDQEIRMNCAIAIEHLVLAAEAQNLGTCWVTLMEVERVGQVLKLPDHLFPVALLAVGHSAQNPEPRPRYPLSEIAFDETLETPWSSQAGEANDTPV